MLLQDIFKQNQILLDLVVDMRAELEVFRTIYLLDKMKNENMTEDEVKKFSEEHHAMIQDSRKTALAQIKAHYLIEQSPDDLLNDALKKDS